MGAGWAASERSQSQSVEAAPSGPEKVLSYTMCRSKDVVRTLRVVGQGEGFKAYYTKAGVDRVVAEGRWRQSCDDVVKNIRANLESAGWRCRDIEKAQVSDFSLSKSP